MFVSFHRLCLWCNSCTVNLGMYNVFNVSTYTGPPRKHVACKNSAVCALCLSLFICSAYFCWNTWRICTSREHVFVYWTVRWSGDISFSMTNWPTSRSACICLSHRYLFIQKCEIRQRDLGTITVTISRPCGDIPCMCCAWTSLQKMVKKKKKSCHFVKQHL